MYKKLKKGDMVVMHTCGEAEYYDGKLWKCSENEFERNGKGLVMLEDFSGAFLTEYLQYVSMADWQSDSALDEKTVLIKELPDKFTMYKESSEVMHIGNKVGIDLYVVWVSGLTTMNEYYSTEYLLEKFNSAQWTILDKLK
jgi:hypothetical protein